MNMHQHNKFGNKMFGCVEDSIWIIWPFMDILNLTLNAVTQNFHKAFWFMMMYHQTKFGYQRISNSEHVVEIVIF